MIVIASDPSVSFPRRAGKKRGRRARRALSPPNARRPVWSVPVGGKL